MSAISFCKEKAAADDLRRKSGRSRGCFCSALGGGQELRSADALVRRQVLGFSPLQPTKL